MIFIMIRLQLRQLRFWSRINILLSDPVNAWSHIQQERCATLFPHLSRDVSSPNGLACEGGFFQRYSVIAGRGTQRTFILRSAFGIIVALDFELTQCVSTRS